MSETITHLGAVREIPDRTGAEPNFRALESRENSLGKILLLGEDNPHSGNPSFQLYPRPIGCAGERLFSKVLGLRREEDYLAIWRANLCSPEWNSAQARRRAWILLGDSVPWSVVVMLGRKVASTFDVANEAGYHPTLDPFTSGTLDTGGRQFTLIALPHPSGRCREWNDPASFSRAQKLMTTHAPTISWGGTLL